MENSESSNIRLAAFDWLNSRLVKYPDSVIPSRVLANNFYYKNERVVLTGQQGIWKPKQMQFPISIKSRIDSIYDDEFLSSNRIKYRYKGNNPNDWVNVGLRQCMLNRIPLIYLHEVARGKYLTQWPVFIVGDDKANLSFLVEAENEAYKIPSDISFVAESDEIERRYATRQMVQRLHQTTFRERVLQAYRNHCAICSLKHRELLDAAHIIPDTKGGKAMVSNGLSLCKIHHAVFDQNIIGIRPDYTLEVRQDILEETDGPMLKYGIQQMHGNKIILPRSLNQQPDKGFLEERYNIFKSAV